ncbi:unnamed protein product, partial [Heterotrigona itama]
QHNFNGARGGSEWSEETPGWKQNGRRDEIEGKGCRSVYFGSGRGGWQQPLPQR